jgi:hypothetical protein
MHHSGVDNPTQFAIINEVSSEGDESVQQWCGLCHRSPTVVVVFYSGGIESLQWDWSISATPQPLVCHCGSRPLPKKQGSSANASQTSFGTEAIESSTATSDELTLSFKTCKGCFDGLVEYSLKVRNILLKVQRHVSFYNILYLIGDYRQSSFNACRKSSATSKSILAATLG